MLHYQQSTLSPVRSLINHLDGALVACEALLQAQGSPSDPHSLLRLELTAIAHVLQAREDMKDWTPADSAVRSQIALFLTVTGCLEETAPSNVAVARFEAASTHLIGGRIEVTMLMALTMAMRDIVELCFLTSGASSGTAHQPPPAITESLVWATNSEA